MHFRILFIPLFLVGLLIISCERDKTPLGAGNNQQQEYPGHDFEWTADTLTAGDAFQIYMYDIWGTEEDNVWCVGHSDLNAYQIWHWDGKCWRNVDPKIQGPRASYLEIFGFAENDFWIAGYTSIYNGYLLHYDGSWHRMDNDELPMCMSIWGSSSQNLFIGCRNGIILRYDGEKFTRYYTGKNLQINTVWGLKSGQVFAIGNNGDNQPAEPPMRYFYKYEKNKFVLIGSINQSLPGDDTIGMDLWGADINSLYSPTGNSLTKYENGKWVTQFYAPLFRIYGSSSNNIFTGGYGSALYHYNGYDWAALHFNDPINESIWGIWCNENYVFVIQDLDNVERIFRGKRKKE